MNAGFVLGRKPQLSDGRLHLLQAPDHVRVVAACHHMIGPGEVQCELQAGRVGVHGIVVELAEVFGGRSRDVRTAPRERLETTIQSLCQEWNRAPRVAEHPTDPGEALGNACVNQMGRRQGRIREKADQRHEHVLFHGLYAQRIGRVDVDDGSGLASPLIERPEALVGQRDARSVAEQHDPRETQLAQHPVELHSGRLGVVHRQVGQRCETVGMTVPGGGEPVVDNRGQLRRPVGGFDAGPRRGEGDHLPVDSGLVEDRPPEVDVAMARNDDVVVAGRVEDRIPLLVLGDPEVAGTRADGVQELRRIVVIMEVDDHAAVSGGDRSGRAQRRYTG